MKVSLNSKQSFSGSLNKKKHNKQIMRRNNRIRTKNEIKTNNSKYKIQKKQSSVQYKYTYKSCKQVIKQ